MATKLDFFYATNVAHYQHVITAAQEVFPRVGSTRRIEFTPELIDRVERLRVPSQVVELMKRRSVPDRDRSVDYFGLGPSQLIMPSLGRLPISHRPWHYRVVARGGAGATARATRATRPAVFQFVEGLGHRALARQDFEHSICERRNFHHEVFESELAPLDGFPQNARPDPLRDIFEYESRRATWIIVYSSVAKQSYVDRGYSADRIFVSPIGIRPLGAIAASPRDSYRLAYVGRTEIHKGVDVAVAATRMLGRPFRLTVAGPASEEVKAWLHAQPHVDYVGVLGRTELSKLYSTAGAVLMPSVESYGLAVWEAAGHGAQIICRETTGAAEYIPPELRTVVHGRDPEVWAKSILAVTESRSDEADLARARRGRQAVDAMSWARAALALRDLYKRLDGPR